MTGSTIGEINANKNVLFVTGDANYSLSEVGIGSTLNLEELRGGVTTITTYQVVGVMATGFPYIVVDPPWYNHHPALYDNTLDEYFIGIKNPGNSQYYSAETISLLEYTRGLNNPYGGANYEFNRIKLNDGSKIKVGSTFRLAGNVFKSC